MGMHRRSKIEGNLRRRRTAKRRSSGCARKSSASCDAAPNNVAFSCAFVRLSCRGTRQNPTGGKRRGTLREGRSMDLQWHANVRRIGLRTQKRRAASDLACEICRVTRFSVSREAPEGRVPTENLQAPMSRGRTRRKLRVPRGMWLICGEGRNGDMSIEEGSSVNFERYNS